MSNLAKKVTEMLCLEAIQGAQLQETNLGDVFLHLRQRSILIPSNTSEVELARMFSIAF